MTLSSVPSPHLSVSCVHCFRSKYASLCISVLFTPQLFCRPPEDRKCILLVSVSVRLGCLAQSRCSKAQRGLQGGYCLPHRTSEKRLKERTPLTHPPRQGGGREQNPKPNLLTLDSLHWAK